MLVGIPKEIKAHEHRVGLIPAAVQELIHHGHEVIMEQAAGEGIGASNAQYEKVGARIVDTAAEVFARAELIIKVKEPQEREHRLLREGQTLFTYLHLAADEEGTRKLMESGATCIAYETVTDDLGRLPLLAPMSEVAGRMSIQAGAACLEKSHGGCGILLGGVPGVLPAHVVIMGGGVVGRNAAKMAVGSGARVTVLEKNVGVLRSIDAEFNQRVATLYSTQHTTEEAVAMADLVIGAVLIPGATAPRLVTEDMVRSMKPGSVVVDVSIDQGGCIATAKPTTHADPTYMKHGVVHYCVSNMPGAVPHTSAAALNHATLPYVLQLADKGVGTALRDNPHLCNGLNVHRGHVTHEAVSSSQQGEFMSPYRALEIK